MSDSYLPQAIPGYVHEIESLRKEILEFIADKKLLTKDFNEALKLLSGLTKEKDETAKELTEKNVELEKEIQDLKSHSTGLNEDVPECLPKHMFDRGEDEVSYLRGLIDFLLKDRQNVKTN